MEHNETGYGKWRKLHRALARPRSSEEIPHLLHTGAGPRLQRIPKQHILARQGWGLWPVDAKATALSSNVQGQTEEGNSDSVGHATVSLYLLAWNVRFCVFILPWEALKWCPV